MMWKTIKLEISKFTKHIIGKERYWVTKSYRLHRLSKEIYTDWLQLQTASLSIFSFLTTRIFQFSMSTSHSQAKETLLSSKSRNLKSKICVKKSLIQPECLWLISIVSSSLYFFSVFWRCRLKYCPEGI